MDQQRFARVYMWSIVGFGSVITLISIYQLRYVQLDLRFVLLAILVTITSLVAVRIPRVSGRITLADTFVFLTMFLFGGPAAVTMSALEGVSTTLLISKKPRTILLNAAMLASSTFVTVVVLYFLVGSPAQVSATTYSDSYFVTICLMALVQYVTNTVLISIEKSWKINASVWRTWKTYYLWTSITYFAGASAAGIAANLIATYGFYAVLVTVPIVVIIYFTYTTYLKNIEASLVQAELAQQHVEELSGYIAELKRSEEVRGQLLQREQRARTEAEAANRIKDEFLATLSHELRTPLTCLLGWACLLRGEPDDERLHEKGIEAIERSAKIQAQLIDDLLDVSRIISGKLNLKVRPVDVSSAIEAAINVVRPAANAKGIQLHYKKASSIGTISGDPGRLQQVVWNLVSNAVKFTPEGGYIEVRVECVDSHVRIIVADTGEGISAEFLPQVFDRFRQADSSTTRKYGGLGLGLAIVRHLVELHGGTVHAESPGKSLGSTFSASFPLLAERPQPEQVNQNGRRTAAAALAGVRVLVLDDEPDARQIISTVIERTGAEVKTCESVPEALLVLQQWHPDVVMSDIAMPDEDGFSFINKVRSLPVEQGGETPAAAFTAYARDEDRKRVLDAGFQMHIPKPVSSSQLVAMLASLTGRAA